MTWSTEDVPAPWRAAGAVVPAETLEGWLGESHHSGRLRQRAVAEVRARLAPFGVQAVVLVGGAWMVGEAAGAHGWRVGPHPAGAPSSRQRFAEGVGDLDAAALWSLVDAYLGACPSPGGTPTLTRMVAGGLAALVVDPSLRGRRPALVVLFAPTELLPALERALTTGATGWGAVLAVAGMLRADRLWVHWTALTRLQAESQGDDSADERPVHAQEVTVAVGRAADAWARAAAEVFEAATVAIFAPDPDDEHVYALGVHGTDRYAYDSGLVPGGASRAGAGFGLTAAMVISAVPDAGGSPVLVREITTRAGLVARYHDLGFDDAQLDGAFIAERYVAPELREVAQAGPWIFTAQRLPVGLSSTRRNLVIRLQGRATDPAWASAEDRARVGRDRKERVAALALRVHADLTRRYADGLAAWRAGLRGEVLRELDGPRRPSVLCRVLASWLSAREVTLWTVDGSRLVMAGWSRRDATPELGFDLSEPLDAREMRLLHAPLYPRRRQVGTDGFFGWAELEEWLGGPHDNVGAAPIVAGGRPAGLIRVDGAMSLMGGFLRRGGPQGGLHAHRPAVTPAHARPALEEVAQLVGLVSLGGGAAEVESWGVFVQAAVRGDRDAEQILSRVAALRDAAGTRRRAAERLGVHRNTLTRHLAALAERVGRDPWGEGA